jgi:hypothetical protein
LGTLTTRRNVSCSSGNDGPNYMLSSNLACHSAGLSVHGLFTDIELDSSAGYLATSRHVCLLRSFLAQYRFELLDCKHHQSIKNHKNITPGAGEDTGHQATLGRAFGFSGFYFPYQNAADCAFGITVFRASVLCVWGGNQESRR